MLSGPANPLRLGLGLAGGGPVRVFLRRRTAHTIIARMAAAMSSVTGLSRTLPEESLPDRSVEAGTAPRSELGFFFGAACFELLSLPPVVAEVVSEVLGTGVALDPELDSELEE